MKINVVLDRFEEDKAVFITDEKKQVIIPKELIESEIKPGQSLQLELGVDTAKTTQNTELAKKMLNEIISNE